MGPPTADGCVQHAHLAVLLVQAVRDLVAATVVAHVLACSVHHRMGRTSWLCPVLLLVLGMSLPMTHTVGSRSISSSTASLSASHIMISFFLLATTTCCRARTAAKTPLISSCGHNPINTVCLHTIAARANCCHPPPGAGEGVTGHPGVLQRLHLVYVELQTRCCRLKLTLPTLPMLMYVNGCCTMPQTCGPPEFRGVTARCQPRRFKSVLCSSFAAQMTRYAIISISTARMHLLEDHEHITSRMLSCTQLAH